MFPLQYNCGIAKHQIVSTVAIPSLGKFRFPFGSGWSYCCSDGEIKESILTIQSAKIMICVVSHILVKFVSTELIFC